MSIDRPGIAKLNIPKSTTKTTTSVRLSTATRGSHGIVMAQRSKVGSGAIFDYNGWRRNEISNLRASLNNNATRAIKMDFVSPQPMVYTAPAQNNSINKYAAAMMGIQMLNETLGSLGNLTKTNSTISSGNTKGTGEASGNSSALNAMKNAKDSTSLRSAIETAQNEKTQMQSELTQLESQLPSMKEASEAASKQLKDLEPKVEAKEKEVKQKEENVSAKEEVLASSEKDKSSKLQVAKNMEAAVGEAASNYTKASEALVNAEATLASTPKTITTTDASGNTTTQPNPAYEKAQQAVEQAKTQKEQAQKELDKAKEGHENAVKNYENSVKAYEQAASDVQTAKDGLKEANAEFEKAQTELNELKKQESEAQSKVKAYEDGLDKQKELQNNIDKYTDEIKSQNNRLTDLENKEQKELTNTNDSMNSLAGKISDRNKKIDTSNGLSFMENRRLAKNEANSEKYDKLTEQRDALETKVNYTKLYKSQGEQIGGKIFRSGSYDGETLYMIGAKPVSAEEFEKQKKLAEQNNTSQS